MRKTVWIAAAAGVAILIAVIVLVVTTISSPLNSPQPEVTPTQVEKTLSGKTIAEDKADVLASATKLLTVANGPQGQADFAALLKKIEAGEVEIPKELLQEIRLAGGLENEEGIESTLYQTLVSFSSLAKQTSGSNEISPRYDNADEAVVLDQEAGVAYVPSTLFIASASGANGFSLEFVYVDGKWIFSPYMTLDQLKLALAFQSSTDAQAE